MASAKGKRCGASYIPKNETCTKRGGGRKAVAGLTAGAVGVGVVGAMSSKRVRSQMGFAMQKTVTNAVHAATAKKPSMKINGRSFSRNLRRQNHLNNARLMVHKMRRKHEPGYRNSKKPFWADGFEGELKAGMFRGDACWKGYVQKGVKRKGNRMVPNCVPIKAKKKSDSVWADGFTPKKTKAPA